jgi:hypothetical protein
VGEKTITSVVAVSMAILGVALIALIVSNKANTGSVLGAGGKSFSGALACALSPVTGGSCGGGTNVTSSVSYDMSALGG